MALKTGVAFVMCAVVSLGSVHSSNSRSRYHMEDIQTSKKLKIEVLPRDPMEPDPPEASCSDIRWDVFYQNVPEVHQKTLLAIAPSHNPQWLRNYFSITYSMDWRVLDALHYVMVPSHDAVREFYAYLGAHENIDLGLNADVTKAIKEIAYGLMFDQRKIALSDIDLSRIFPYVGSYMGMRVIQFDSCQISDLAAFASLRHTTHLRTLKLSNNHISDIESLKHLEQLRDLWLCDNQIKDINSLSRLTKLKKLVLKKNQVMDLMPLAGLRRIVKLNLNGNGIVDITPLSYLRQLRVLNLDGNKIKDLSALEGLSELTILDLARNNITDISPLRALSRIEELTIEKNQISDISALSQLSLLTDLYIHKNPITDLSPLVGLTHLEYLYASVPKNMNYLSLKSMVSLADVDLYIKSVWDLSSFTTLPNIFQVSLVVSKEFNMTEARKILPRFFVGKKYIRVLAKQQGMKDIQEILYSDLK